MDTAALALMAQPSPVASEKPALPFALWAEDFAGFRAWTAELIPLPLPGQEQFWILRARECVAAHMLQERILADRMPSLRMVLAVLRLPAAERDDYVAAMQDSPMPALRAWAAYWLVEERDPIKTGILCTAKAWLQTPQPKFKRELRDE